MDLGELHQPGRVALAVREVANADLYRNNAFRLSGLPVDTTLRKLRRLSTELAAAVQLGSAVPRPAGPLRVSPPPEPTVVLDALRRSRDPVRRIVDEFFWFWPFPSGGLGGSDLDEATRGWDELADPDADAGGDEIDPSDRAIAIHNQAVIAHVKALEDGFDSPQRSSQQWRCAYRSWRRVLAEDECWSWLAGRVEAINDPRLRVDSIAEIRRELPAVLLGIHAGLATAAASATHPPSSARNSSSKNTAQHGTSVHRHLAAMRTSGFDPAMIERALVAAVEPHATRLRALSEQAREATGGPDAYQNAYATLVTESATDLRVLRALLGKDHPSAAGIVDDLASRMHELVVRDVNERPNESRAALPDMQLLIDRLDRAHDLAAGVHVKEQIAQDTRTLLANRVVAICNSTLKKSQANPRAGLNLHRKLLNDTSDARTHLARLGDGDSSVQDEVAGTAFVMLVSYFNSTRDGESTIPALRIAQKLARNPQLRDRISDAIDKIEAAARPDPSPLLPEPPTRPTKNAERRADVAADRCALCTRAAHTTRPIVMAPHNTGDYRRRDITIPCCEGCQGKPVAPAFKGVFYLGVLGPVLLLAAAVVPLYIDVSKTVWLALSIIFTLLGWGLTSEVGGLWLRHRAVSRHPPVRECLRAGWKIVE